MGNLEIALWYHGLGAVVIPIADRREASPWDCVRLTRKPGRRNPSCGDGSATATARGTGWPPCWAKSPAAFSAAISMTWRHTTAGRWNSRIWRQVSPLGRNRAASATRRRFNPRQSPSGAGLDHEGGRRHPAESSVRTQAMYFGRTVRDVHVHAHGPGSARPRKVAANPPPRSCRGRTPAGSN